MKTETYIDILNHLKSCIDGGRFEGHVFVVGGAVRDFLMDRTIKDIDLVVDLPNGGVELAEYLQGKGLCKNVVTYENFGTVTFTMVSYPEISIEAVHTRKECYHDAKTRNPETAFGTIKEDWQRRDFTINAIYYDITNEKILDFDERGQKDIEDGVIRTCGDPSIIFNEDPLRILRMVRFATRFDFDIDVDTWHCAKRCVDRLRIISKERITDEFTAIMTQEYPVTMKGLCMLRDLGAMWWIIPGYHYRSTFQMYEIIRGVYEMYATFYNYEDEVTGPAIVPVLTKLLDGLNVTDEQVKVILQGVLKYPNDVLSKVLMLRKENRKLSEWVLNPKLPIAELRRIMNECGDMETFLLATITGSDNVRVCFHWEDDDFSTYFRENCDSGSENSVYYDYKLPVNGVDVMTAYGIVKPSKKVKEILDRIMTFALSDPKKMTRDACMEHLHCMAFNERWHCNNTNFGLA